jgi:hypothetical protein
MIKDGRFAASRAASAAVWWSGDALCHGVPERFAEFRSLLASCAPDAVYAVLKGFADEGLEQAAMVVRTQAGAAQK